MGLEVAQVHWGVARREGGRGRQAFAYNFLSENMCQQYGGSGRQQSSDDERKFALATTFHFILLTGMLKAKKTECRVGEGGLEQLPNLKSSQQEEAAATRTTR